MRLSPRAGLFGGVALLSAAAVLLSIVLTRLFSALFGHHLAFLAVSLSLFGVGAGGALLHAVPALVRPPGILARLAVLSCLASAASIAAILYLVQQKPITTFGPSEAGKLGLLYLVSAAPFTFAGIAVAGAIRHAARDMSALYLVDLLAAAAGGVSAMLALRVGAPRAVLIVAMINALAALWFVLPLRTKAARRARVRGPFGLVATMLLGTAVLFAGDFGNPWLKLADVREVHMDKVDFQKWSLLALVTVDKPAAGMAWLRMDGSAATAILDTKTTAPLHPDEMGYVLRKDVGPVLVIGSGGGRDIRAALKYGQTDIDAAEINPVIVEDVMRDKYKDFSGALYDRPDVHVAVADGRSFVRASPRKYSAIVISLVDTWAASSVGALALSENSLYTVEAFRDYLEHLQPEGTLTVNRWDGEIPRLVALATAGLRAFGSENPRSHLFACSHDRTTAVLVKRTPLTKDEILRLRGHCNKNRFREVFAPDVARNDLADKLVATPAGFIDPNGDVDLRAPTDDRPFFFHTVPARAVGKILASPKQLAQQQQGLAMLFGLFAVSAAFAALFLFVPLAIGWLRARGGAAPRTARARPLAFFLCIGGGFVLVEMGVMQQLTLFLGHPIYAVTTALVVLLLSAGLGSLSTSRVALAAAPGVASRRAQALVVLLALLAVFLGPVLGRAILLSFPMRVVFTVALLCPVGLLMGSLAPIGVKLVGSRSSTILPWCWGLNGFASVMGTAAGTFIAMSFGFSATLLLAGLAYLIAAVTVPRYEGEAAPA
jgi:spermidine synthase